MARELTAQEFKDICSSIKDPIRVVDKDLNIIWANEATMKIFGSDIVGRKCHEAFHQQEEPCEPYPCSTVKAFQDNEVSDFEIQNFDKTGEKLSPHGVTNLAIRDEAGKLTAIIKITRDFSDLLQKKYELEKSYKDLELLIKDRSNKLDENGRKLKKARMERERVERDRQESEKRFSSLVENLPIGICIVQHDTIIYQNPSLKKLLGRIPNRFITNIINSLDVIHPDDVEKCREAYQQIRSGRTQTSEVDFRFYPAHEKGRAASLSYVSGSAVLIDYRGERAILITLVDRTRIKKTEELLTIREKMVSLGHVAAGMAHEIRNPLTGINSYLFTLEDLCERETIEGDDIKLLKKIVSQFHLASEKIETVIKRVLDFSRPNPPAMKLIDLNQCIEKALNLSAASLRQLGVKIEKSLEQDLPHCYADSHLIEQVLLNLTNNALQAMDKSPKDKTLQIETFSKKERLCINVSDSGPGVSEKIKNQIFDPFYTTHNDGTGIGLSITHRIITDHHGTITIMGNKLGGATFSIELPLEKRIRAR